jgi:urease accessory protein
MDFRKENTMGTAIKSGRVLLGALAALLAAAPAWAHTPGVVQGGFAQGLFHPLTGADHVLAMVSLGILAALLGGRRVWQLPLAFMGVMAIGGMVGFIGLPLFAVEQMIALSVLVLGLVIAVSARLPQAASLALVAAFALFHGHAHGTELAAGASPVLYSLGFLGATGLLHAGGIGLGLGLGRRSPWVYRLAGSAIGVAGVVLLVQAR